MIKNICTYDMHVLVNGSRTNAPRKNASLRKNAPRKIVPWKIAPKKNCPPKKCPLGKLPPLPQKITHHEIWVLLPGYTLFYKQCFFQPSLNVP